MAKNIPYIFLLVLILILLFVGGVRYGRNVEQTNKTISYLLSIPPTKPAPTIEPTKAIMYKTYISDCGIKFLYPSSLRPTLYQGLKEAVKFIESDLSESSEQAPLTIFCSGSGLESFSDFMSNSDFVKKTSTSSGIIKNDEIILYEKDNMYFFKIENKMSQRNIGVSVSKQLYPLIESTLDIITPTPTKINVPTPISTPFNFCNDEGVCL